MKYNRMRYIGLIILTALLLESCMTKDAKKSEHVFMQAQVQYVDKGKKKLSQDKALMPSYFLAVEYQDGDIKLSEKEAKKLTELFKQLAYSEEYTLNITAGIAGGGNLPEATKLGLSRLKLFKKMIVKPFARVETAILKKQPENTVYVRLLA